MRASFLNYKMAGMVILIVSVFFDRPGTSCHAQAERVALVDLLTRDTIHSWTLDSTTTCLEFTCGDRIWKSDAAVLVKITPYGTLSVVVPVAANSVNTYAFGSSGLIPFYFEGWEKQRYLSFSGNNYLCSYNAMLEKVSYVEAETNPALLTSKFINDLAALSKKFNQAQIVGYHLFTMREGVTDKMSGKPDPKAVKKVERLISEGNGFFFDELKRTRKNFQELSCVQHPDTLLKFQSADSKIDPSLIAGNVHVIIFWATWCGPCKPRMKFLSDLNKESYHESPVIFSAVTSENDFAKSIAFFNEHSEYNGLALFHDSHLCMSKAYKIEHLPTLLIFDKTGALVARDPDVAEVKAIVDGLLRAE